MSTSFRRRNSLHVWDLHFGPNMTPMVDVVMVILVFFMASTAFIGPEWLLRIGLAEEARPGESGFRLGPAELVVKLDVADDQVVVTGLGLAGASLEAMESAAVQSASTLGSAASATHIVLEPADSVSYEAVVRAQEIFVEAGFEHIAIR